ncbi:bifunctional adenosylcobinamide kinase/adenosylcobinamide-phosphate guanylyltransferase [Halobacillus mangrovi]|uniref:bifunctional adenosylcobinamide kinase/adenosylcobinamide-phosphate guanylyltransferase n=1 Tax=Halobacillus mangrovi TaxID=402384 RepID=UPI003D95BFAD
MLTLIIGGVRSGKSTLAEKLAIQSHKNPIYYIATSVNTDGEMNERILKHQIARKAAPKQWIVFENPTRPSTINLPLDATVLLDCVTTWATNEWMERVEKETIDELINRMVAEVEGMMQCAANLILVSNDLFSDAIEYGPAIKDYLRLIGTIHQKLVKKADRVVKMEFGCTQVKKGRIL